MSNAAGFGRFVSWDGGCLFISHATSVTPMHAHYAIQIAFGSEPGIRFRPSERYLRGGIAALPDDALAEVAMAGESLSSAAHSAGFADAAHLTRTCRRMFGFPPSALQAGDPLRADEEKGGRPPVSRDEARYDPPTPPVRSRV